MMEKVDDQKRAKIAYGRPQGEGKDEGETLPSREVGADGLKGCWQDGFTKVLDHPKPEAGRICNLLFSVPIFICFFCVFFDVGSKFP